MTFARALLGLLFFLVVAWLLSSDRRRINVRVVVGGLLLQLVFAFVILQTTPGRQGLEAASAGVAHFLKFSEKGAEFVFGPLTTMEYVPTAEGETPKPLNLYAPWEYHRIPESERSTWPIAFAFRALPTIIFFSAVMGILYHLGVMQWVVRHIARVMRACMRVSGAESLAMAANIFVGQTEAPLVVRPYIGVMTRSELMALMTGGFATIAGSVLAAYIGFLGPEYAGHLLAASFMSAPAAFVMAKVMVPETESSRTSGTVTFDVERKTANVLDAAASGTGDGLKLYLNVVAMLIAFVSLVALINWPLGAAGDAFGTDLSLERILGWIFSPVAWAMGVQPSECMEFGKLLGTKVAVNEFIAYDMLGKTDPAVLGERSRAMAAYALCGFANFSSIGIQLGGIGALAPGRRKDLARIGLKAMIGGACASWMTATIAGAFL